MALVLVDQYQTSRTARAECSQVLRNHEHSNLRFTNYTIKILQSVSCATQSVNQQNYIFYTMFIAVLSGNRRQDLEVALLQLPQFSHFRCGQFTWSWIFLYSLANASFAVQIQGYEYQNVKKKQRAGGSKHTLQGTTKVMALCSFKSGTNRH